MNENINFLTTRQVSQYLCIPERTVQSLSEHGKIKAFKFGRQWRYPKKDIERYGVEYSTSNKSNFINAKDVSKCLCIHLRTIRRLSKQGKIKSFKIGRQWRYSREDVERYITNSADFSNEPSRKTDNDIEHRSYPRINCFLPCQIKVIIPQKKEISSQVNILNLSEGGLFFENYYNKEAVLQIQNDDPVDLEFELAGKGKVNVNGRILRKQEERIAVKFREISEDSREKITHYVG